MKILKIVWLVVRWCLGVTLILSSIGGFFSHEYIAASLVLLSGALILPPVYQIIFNRKGKLNKDENPLTCALCNKRLHFLNKPLWGLGKLDNGKEICMSCYNKIQAGKIKEEWRDTLKGFKKLKPAIAKTKPTTINEAKRPIKNKYAFPFSYYQMLKEFGYLMSGIYDRLNNDKTIWQALRANPKGEMNDDFISLCVTYDLVYIAKNILGDKLKHGSMEAAGIFLVINKITRGARNIFGLDNDYEIVARAYEKKLFRKSTEPILLLTENDNPLKIDIQKKEDGLMVSSEMIQSNLSIATYLEISGHPLFNEYASALYRFANIIAKADNEFSPEEKENLDKVYQILFTSFHKKMESPSNISLMENNATLNDTLNSLDALIGLDEVKNEIKTLVNFVKVQQAREKTGLRSSSISYHIVFTGNPGTGKTTVARIVAQIYKHLAILTEGQLIETDRSGLVAGYAGQTAIKTNQVIDSALDGVLFIDEAYALVGHDNDDFGREAVATLIKRMEDDRERLVVILAGYTEEMKTFIETNPGFKSRFNRYISFPDYTPDELLRIFELNCQKLDYLLTDEAKTKTLSILNDAYSSRDRSFGNGRFARNVFEKTLERQANRISLEPSLTQQILVTITADDIE